MANACKVTGRHPGKLGRCACLDAALKGGKVPLDSREYSNTQFLGVEWDGEEMEWGWWVETG